MEVKETETSQPDKGLTVDRTLDIPRANNQDKNSSEDTAVSNKKKSTGEASTDGPLSSQIDSTLFSEVPPRVKDDEENMESQIESQGALPQQPLPQETPTGEQTDPEKNVETIGPASQIDLTPLTDVPPSVKECTGEASTDGPGSSPEDILTSPNDIPPLAEDQGDGQQQESPNKHEEVQSKTTDVAQPDRPVQMKEESGVTSSVGSDEPTENIVQNDEVNMESQIESQGPQETPTAEQTDPEKNVETLKPLTEVPPSVKGGKRIIFWIAVAFVALFAVIIQQRLQRKDASQETARRQIDIFHEGLDKMKLQFPSQREELWKRSRIHLQRHFLVDQPTEPISIILTAGASAEVTLHCLAQSIASALSSALNASALHLDGASKSSQDSDKVKSDIDGQLQKAFEGGKPIAVIHRFEELPPASTLIFYRYCDHENAAFKKTFLIFTVVLGEEEEIPAKIRLSEVEEMVTDHLQKKFLSHGQPSAFDKMDIDKYGGLWSRISHLILPVATEKRIENTGQC